MRILLAWELGANLGHVMPLRLLAHHLRAMGHQPLFALRDLDVSESVLEPALGPVLQAPIRLGDGRNPVARQLSYASLLHNCGFDDALGLAGRLRAWRRLLQEQRVDYLFADHAPTALLAARSLGLPRFNVGAGFFVPPLLTPFPAFGEGAPPAPGQLERNEGIVLGTVNRALERLQLAPLAALQDVLGGAGAAVTSVPELDHYQVARPEPYVGVPDFSSGATPKWPEPRAPRLFAYLRPSRLLPRLLEALQQSSAHVLVRVADIPAERLRRYARPNLLITERAVQMREAAQSCDAFLNYAAHGTTAEMLLAGKPGLLLPDTVERVLVARRAVELGAALVPADAAAADFPALIQRLIEDTALHRAAQALARRHAGLDRAGIAQAVIQTALAG